MRLKSLILALSSALCFGLAAHAQDAAKVFTFQGRLDNAGTPASGLHDIRVTPYDAALGGAALAPTLCVNDVNLTDGLFTIDLPTSFTSSGSAYLELQVRPDPASSLGCNNATGFTILGPRQAVTPAPAAAYAFAMPTRSPDLPGAIRYNAELARFEGFVNGFWTPFLMGEPLAPANTQSFTAPGIFAFTVPAGVSSLGADVWGAGGGGGSVNSAGFNATSCPIPNPSRGGGGGGGSGAYARVSMPVTPGETITIVVGVGGNGGSFGAGGNPGAPSRLQRGSTILVTADGGLGGSVGLTHAPATFPQSSGPGGGGGPAPTIAAGVTALASQLGNTGGWGAAPYGCGAFPNNFLFPAAPGSGASGRSAGAPLTVTSAGNGGPGAVTASIASAGAHGAVRLFWN